MKQIKSKVEVLITTMHCKDPISLLDRMHIENKAMIGNQCDHDDISFIEYKGNQIPIYSFEEKGVGLNRNNLWMRTQSEYVLFGDDDLVYVDDYEQIVLDAFKTYPDADVLIFNLEEKEKTRYKIEKSFKVKKYNFMRFGAARICVRTSSLRLHGILFNLSFGGGCPHSNGEDTLFLAQCLKQKLKIYAVPITIARLEDQRASTWFHGYDDQYLYDKGILYYVMSPKWSKFLMLQDALRHHKDYHISFKSAYQKMKEGSKYAKHG